MPAATAPDPAAGRIAAASPPSAAAPLAGVTVLAVEDSRFACDALRLMCQRLGARLRRAETMAAAARHLRSYRPDLVLVDLGLPDGDGAALIGRLAALPGGPPVLGMSGEDGAARALAAGAAGFLPKPVERLADFRDALIAHLPARAWLAALPAPAGAPAPRPDPLALRDDLAAAARRLAADPDPLEGRYLAGFLAGIASAARDPALADLACAAGAGPEGRGALAQALAQRLSPPLPAEALRFAR